MGISKVVGVAATILLLTSVYLRMFGMKLISIPFFVDALIGFLVAIASHPTVNIPLLLGKHPDGRFPIWSMLLFGQYLVFVCTYTLFKRLKHKEPVYNEISEGLYVGGWPFSEDHVPPGQPAVIDCTCELPRSSVLSQSDYLCIPTWDTRSPRLSDIESAVQWVCRKRAQKKPIYIHCASGHGRSVCVMSAVLVALGMAEDWKHAEKMIRERRPRIRMNVHHRKILEEWSKHQALKEREVDVSSMALSGASKNQ